MVLRRKRVRETPINIEMKQLNEHRMEIKEM